MQLGVLEYLISVNNSKLKKGIQESDREVQSYGNKLSSWAMAKGQLIARVAEKAVTSIGNFAKGAITETADFDKNMSQVAATLGKTTAEIKQLSDFARKMGSETAFTAGEAAQALNYMALAGYDAEKSMKMLPQVLNLAAAGNFELARASDMVTDAQSALGLSIEDTEVLIDQMAKASSKTNTSVEQLGDAILTVGGTAKMMKGGTEELTSVLGVLADNGIKGSEGGTALRNVLLALSAPTDKAAKQLKSLGVSVFDAQGNMRNISDIMADMNTAMSGMTSEQRTSIINEIFNKRDLKSVEALLGTSAERWAELSKEIGNSKDAAKQMAETQLDNLAGDVTKFKSALGEAKISIVEKLTPSLRNLTKTGTVIVQRLTKAWGKGGFLGALKEVKSVVKDITKGFKTGLAKVLKIDNPDTASWGDIGSEILKRIKEKVSGKKIVDWIKNSIGKTKVFIGDLLDAEKGEDGSYSWGSIAKAVTDNLKKAFKSVKIGIASMLGVNVGNNSDIAWSTIAKAAREKLKTALNKTKIGIAKMLNVDAEGDEAKWSEIAKAALERIKEGFKTAAATVKLSLSDLFGLTKTDSGKGKKIADKIIADGGVAAILEGTMDDLESTESASWFQIGIAIVKWIGKGVKSAVAASKNILTEWLDLKEDATWGEIGTALFNKVKDGVTNLAGQVKNVLTDWLGLKSDDSWGAIGTALFNKIKTAVKTAVGTVKNVLTVWLGLEADASWSAIGTELHNKIRDGAKSALGAVKNTLTDWLNLEQDANWRQIGRGLYAKVRSGVKGLVGNVKNTLTDWLNLKEDASWQTIGQTLATKIKTGFGDGKAKLAELFGLDSDASWSDIGSKIATGIGDTFKKGKSLLLKILLGDDYEEGKSTFTDVGEKLSAWISEGFKEGGFLEKLVTGFVEHLSTKWTTISNILASLITGLADWLSNEQNVQTFIGALVTIVTTIAGSIDKIIMPLFNAIIGTITSPEFVGAITSLASVLTDLLVKVITSEDLWNALGVLVDTVLRSILGDNIVSLILGDKKKLEYYTNDKGERHTKLVEDKEAKEAGESFITKFLRGAFGTEAGSDSFGDRLARWLGGDTDILSVLFGEKNTKKAAEKLQEALNNIKMLITGEAHIKLKYENYGGTPGDVAMYNNLGSGAAHTKSFDGRNDPGKYPTLLVNPTELRGGARSGGSYAKGNWSVPYDNFPALLHRDEMVLNKSQARRYRDGQDVDYTAIGSMIGSSVERAMNKVYVMMSGEKVGDLTTRRVKKNINASTYSKLRAMGGA